MYPIKDRRPVELACIAFHIKSLVQRCCAPCISADKTLLVVRCEMAVSSSLSNSSASVLPSPSPSPSLSPFDEELKAWRLTVCFLPFEEAVVSLSRVSKAFARIFAPGEHWVIWKDSRWPNDVPYSMILKKREVTMDEWISQWQWTVDTQVMFCSFFFFHSPSVILSVFY